jgi:type VI secretion system secreted protein VgrG
LKFSSVVTPNPATVFSPLVFAREIDLKTYTPIDEGTVFLNPIRRIVAVFSFDGMTTGVQWTTLWYRDGQLVYYETIPWADTTGGYGFVERVAAPDEWLPGAYEVQIFVGNDWQSVGRFVVEGEPPTATPTRAPTATKANTATRVPRATSTVTRTRLPSPTATPSWTPAPSATRAPTRTLLPTDTPWPSQTPAPAP